MAEAWLSFRELRTRWRARTETDASWLGSSEIAESCGDRAEIATSWTARPETAELCEADIAGSWAATARFSRGSEISPVG